MVFEAPGRGHAKGGDPGEERIKRKIPPPVHWFGGFDCPFEMARSDIFMSDPGHSDLQRLVPSFGLTWAMCPGNGRSCLRA